MNESRKSWRGARGFKLSKADRRLLKRILVVGVGAFIVGYGLAALTFYSGTSYPDIVNVPDLRTMPATSARRALERIGLQLEIGDSLPNPEVAAGAVVAQSPLPGREVPPGTPVRVIISSGAQRRPIPSVESLGQSQAVALLESAGFTVAVDSVEDQQPAGRVLGIQPAAGTAVALPATVRLRVSSGPPFVEVPYVVGMDESVAREVVSAAGLRVGDVHYIFSFNPEGEVLGQEPAPGDSIRAGTRIVFRVSTHRLPGEAVRPGEQRVEDGEIRR